MSNVKVLVAVSEGFRERTGQADMSYNLPTDQQYALLQLLLYIFSFATLILIFLYIAAERPGEAKKKAAEEEE